MTGLGGNATPDWKLLLSESGSSLSQLTESSANWVSAGGELYNTDTVYSKAYFTSVPSGVYLGHIIEAEIKFVSGGSGVKTAGVYMGSDAGSESGVPPIDVGEFGAAALVSYDYSGALFDPDGLGLALGTWFHLRLVVLGWVGNVYVNGVNVDSAHLLQSSGVYSWLHLDPNTGDFRRMPGIFTEGSGAGQQSLFRNLRYYVSPIRLPGLT